MVAGSIPARPTLDLIMIKHIFFDGDGMVVNKPKRFSQHLASDYGISTAVTDEFFKNEFLAAEAGKADLKEELKKYLGKWGWQKSLDEFLRYWFQSEHYLDDRLLASIRELRKRGLLCHLATNQEKYRAEYMRDQMGLEEVFDNLFISADLGHRKPSQEFWMAAHRQLGIPDKSQVLVWDDKQDRVDSARQFGFHAELYKNFDDYKTVLDSYL